LTGPPRLGFQGFEPVASVEEEDDDEDDLERQRYKRLFCHDNP